MRFVGRELFIEPVELQVFVIVVLAALNASLRKFDVLQQGNYVSALYADGKS